MELKISKIHVQTQIELIFKPKNDSRDKDFRNYSYSKKIFWI